jgi:hypothetical protein
VVLPDHLARRAAARLLVLDIPDPDTFRHTRKLPRVPSARTMFRPDFPRPWSRDGWYADLGTYLRIASIPRERKNPAGAGP